MTRIRGKGALSITLMALAAASGAAVLAPPAASADCLAQPDPTPETLGQLLYGCARQVVGNPGTTQLYGQATSTANGVTPNSGVIGPDGMTYYPGVPDIAGGVLMTVSSDPAYKYGPVVVGENLLYPDGYAIYGNDPNLAPIVSGEGTASNGTTLAGSTAHSGIGLATTAGHGVTDPWTTGQGTGRSSTTGSSTAAPAPCSGGDSCYGAHPTHSWPEQYVQDGNKITGYAAWTYLAENPSVYEQGDDHYESLWAQNTVTLGESGYRLYSVYNKVTSGTGAGSDGRQPFLISWDPSSARTYNGTGNPTNFNLSVGAGPVSLSTSFQQSTESWIQGGTPSNSGRNEWAEWGYKDNPILCGSGAWNPPCPYGAGVTNLMIYDRPPSVSSITVNMVSGAQYRQY